MRRLSLRLLLLALLGTMACGEELALLDNPTPIVQSLEPGVVTRSASGAEVQIRGLGFVQASVARWDGGDRPTSYVGPTELRVTLTGADLEGVSGEVDVTNPAPGGGASDPVTLVVGNPIATITGMSPSTAQAPVSPEIDLLVTGENFIVGPPASIALWNGIPLPTNVVSATELAATVPDYLLQDGDSVRVSVLNPAPGGGRSPPVLFGLENPAPVVTGTDPDGVTSGLDSPIEVLGSGFVAGTRVWVDGTALAPSAVSSTRLEVVVPGPLAVGGTTLSLHAENPAPGGGTSEEFTLHVWTSPPIIDYLRPSIVFAGGESFTMTVVGHDLDRLATATIDGAPRSTTWLDTTRLEVEVLDTDVATEGQRDVRVMNPGNGGIGEATLTVIAPGEENLVVAERWGASEIVFASLDGGAAQDYRPRYGVARVDGSPVSYAAVYHARDRIWEIDGETGDERALTTGTAAQPGSESWPRYSGDGAWVYFQNSGDIWRVRVDGSAAEDLGVDGAYPSVANRSDRFVYAAGGAGGPLHVYDPATGTSTPLGMNGSTSRWSPDDQWIIYLAAGWDLRAVQPDGSNDMPVVTSVDVGYGFDFTADGSAIITTTQNGDAIMVAFPSGTITELTGFGPLGSIALLGR